MPSNPSSGEGGASPRSAAPQTRIPDRDIPVKSPGGGSVLLRDAAAGELRPATRPLGFDPVSAGSLSIHAQATALSALLADRKLNEPFAVGIFGEAGSGRSFFMRRMQAEVADLADSSAREGHDGERSAACPNVCQIHFSTSLHAGDGLPESFAVALARAVAGVEANSVNGQERLRALTAFQAAQRAALARVAEREALVQKLDEMASDINSLHREMSEQLTLLGDHGQAVLAAAQSLAAMPNSWGGARLAWKSSRLWVKAVAAVGAIGAVVLVVRVLTSGQLLYTLPALAPLAGIGVILRNAVRRVTDVLGIQRRLIDRGRQKAAIEQELQRLGTASKDEEVAIAAASLLPERLSRHSLLAGAAVQSDDGLESLLWYLAHLEDLITGRRRERGQATTAHLGPVPLDRVIVYMDDLDRSDPRTVVQALAVARLLTSLSAFRVVIAADWRWLMGVLGGTASREAARGDEATIPRWQDGDSGSRPRADLENLFQVSFSLPPLSESSFDQLLEGELPVLAESAHRARVPGLQRRSRVQRPRTAPAEGRNEPELGSGVEIIGPSARSEMRGPLVDFTVSAPELEFTKLLAPLFRTPRSVKRFTCLYRLIRSSLDPEGLVLLLRSEPPRPPAYPALLTLLGVAVAVPDDSSRVFRAMLSSDGSEPWALFVTGSAHTTGPWLSRVLGSIASAHGPLPVDEYLRWLPVVVRHSYPWQEVALP